MLILFAFVDFFVILHNILPHPSGRRPCRGKRVLTRVPTYKKKKGHASLRVRSNDQNRTMTLLCRFLQLDVRIFEFVCDYAQIRKFELVCGMPISNPVRIRQHNGNLVFGVNL